MDLGRKRPADEAILCRRVSQASTGSSPSHYVIPSPLTSLQAGLSSQTPCSPGDNSLHLLD